MNKQLLTLALLIGSTSLTINAQTYWMEGGQTPTVSNVIGNNNTSLGGIHHLVFRTLNTNQMILTDAGNVGLGTLTPASAYKMEMTGSLNLNSGNSALERALWVNGKEAILLKATQNYFSWGFGGSYNFFDKGITVGFTNAPAIAPPSKGLIVEGNVGFGTSAPGVNLDIKGATNPAMALTATGVGAAAVMGIASSGSSYSANAVAGDVVFGPKGGASHDLILSCQNANSGSIRFKSGPIGGDVEYMTMKHNGNVGIGVTNPQNKLEVCGLVRAKEVIVETMWCDFVFEKTYRLRPLSEVETFINANKHLPEIPPAAEVEAHGIKVGEVNAKLLQKIEELTLYMIEADKQIKALQAENQKIKSDIATVKNDSGK